MKLLGVQVISADKLYHGYKESLRPYYEKYFRQEPHPLLWCNTPISIFVEDYIKMGKEILDHLDDHLFIRYEYERYSDSETVKDDSHKFNAARRIINMVDSVREHGYAKGKFNNKKHLIRVEKGFKSPYGSDLDGFKLLSRKHRAAAVVGMGIKEFKVRVHASK